MTQPQRITSFALGGALGCWFSLGGIRTARQAMKERLIKAAEKEQ